MSYADDYREHGYVHAGGVFDAAAVGEMRDGLARILADVEGTEHDANHKWGAVAQEAVLKGFHNVEFHDAAFTRAAAHPRIGAVLTELVGPNVQLHHTKMLVKPPEQGAPFPMHQDYPYFPHTLHSVVAASVHLDDTDEENGCLRVVPGSHKQGPIDATGESHTLAVPLEEGTPDAGAGGRRPLLQLPDDPRLRRELERPYATEPSVPVPRPRGCAAAAERARGTRHWGQGVMVAGRNPVYWARRPRFRLQPA